MTLNDFIRSLPADSARDLLRVTVARLKGEEPAPSPATFLSDLLCDNMHTPPPFVLPAIYDELGSAIHQTTAAERAWLQKRGAVCPLIGCCGCLDDGAQWTPDADSPRAFIFPILEGPHDCRPNRILATRGHGQPIIEGSKVINYVPLGFGGEEVVVVDLAAWRPSAPSVVRLRSGLSTALGEWNLEAVEDRPLRIRATPLAWAAADFDGAVILDWEACAGALLEQRHIACDSLDLAEKLNEVLARERKRATPRKPEVGVVKDG